MCNRLLNNELERKYGETLPDYHSSASTRTESMSLSSAVRRTQEIDKKLAGIPLLTFTPTLYLYSRDAVPCACVSISLLMCKFDSFDLTDKLAQVRARLNVMHASPSGSGHVANSSGHSSHAGNGACHSPRCTRACSCACSFQKRSMPIHGQRPFDTYIGRC